jgi:aminopeptidase Y
MVFSSGFALCAAITGAVALQIPLLSSVQTPLGHPSGSKPMVNSTELQDLISGDRLMIRAKKLYEIAKLGEEEFNHPTRVIGSAGMLVHVSCLYLDVTDHSKATPGPCRTFTRRS